MPTSVGIYDDSTLPAIIQSIELLTPWTRTPSASDFAGENKPFKQVPILSWPINMRETEVRSRLISHLGTKFPGIDAKINALPDGFVLNMLANLGYGVTTLYHYSLLPRLDNVFNPSIYAVASLWVGYYLFESLRTDYEEDTTNDGQYRYKQLSDLIDIVGYTLRTIISENALVKGNHVIVSATVNSEDRNVVYTDNSNLSVFVDRGGSLKTLASQWITSKSNPTV
ncbi:hypothetical protein MOA67_gp110 [Klebsiella phage KpLz-2_45]|uniref:hypothetical protein n=1 Tax=Klebsiella phage KpLz-2_45 TaxID=2698923 RepID=UPI001F1450B9|nr:hypothetical protein MOA67_gp110 [Klebsiella phage KpLz-2_45]UKS71976.1 hypothetical protein KpLz245_1100 [Klebsiella phage KpLz-2_45]